MRIFSKYILLLLTAGGLTSCFNEPTFDLTPSIEYNNVEKFIRIDLFSGSLKDSVVVAIDFQDGDGDLGLNEQDKAVAVETNDYNFIVKTFRQRDGEFEEFSSGVPLSGYFPVLKLDDRVGPIEGTLNYSMDFFHAFTPQNEVVKFEIQIKDRSGNLSNVVESEEIVLNATIQ